MFLDKFAAYLNRRGGVQMQTPWTGTIGNCAEEIYFGLLKARRERTKVCLLFPKDAFGWFRFSRKKRNNELPYITSPFRLWSERHVMVFIAEWFLSGVYYIFHLSSRLLTLSSRVVGRRLQFPDDYIVPTFGQQQLWSPPGATTFSRELAEQLQWSTQLNTYLPVGLPNDHEAEARAIREELGLLLSDWFVCLHVRKGGMYNDYAEAYFRNASIRNYFKAISEITRRGGWVVRLGDPTMMPLPAMERVIDCAHDPARCDLMDIYFIKECSLYIGSQSGIWDVAALFQKPLLMPNMCEWSFSYSLRRSDLGILKHLWSRATRRFLSIDKLVRMPERCQYILGVNDDFIFYENSEDEILSLVQEYYQNASHRELTELQGRFNAHRVAQNYRALADVKFSGKQGIDTFRFRIASRLEGCTGAIADGFLRANWEVNSRNTTSTYYGRLPGLAGEAAKV